MSLDFQTVFAVSRTPMALADIASLRFLEVNDAYCEMTGYTRDELLALTPLEITVPEDAERELALFTEVLGNARPAYGMEKRFVHKSGRLVWASVSVTVLRDAHGAPKTGVAICEDITARREAEAERLRFEKELLQAQKLESLGLMAGGIAHDFNNILVGVLGNAELARQGAEDGTQRELLDDVLAAAEMAAGLCQQMLAYSGGGALEVDRVDLGRAVESGLRLLDSAKRSRVAFEAAHGPMEVDADLNQMQQLVLNLATNACEASGVNDVVRVRVGTRTGPPDGASVITNGGALSDAVCLEVEDDGPGVHAEALHAAFEPFVSTKGPGRGLGLAAVLGIVRSHGATLWVEHPPVGTRFVVAFPPARRPQRIPSEEQGDVGTTPPQRVLVVDDQPAVLRVVARMLARQGHEVVSAGGARDAVARLGEAGIDMVISDLTLGDGSGLDVLAAARGLPVLLVTGHAEEALSALAAGTRVLRKPFRPEELARAMHELTSAARLRE